MPAKSCRDDCFEQGFLPRRSGYYHEIFISSYWTKMSQRILKAESMPHGLVKAIIPRLTSRWLSRVALCLWQLDYNLSFYLENAWVSNGEAPPCHLHTPGKMPRIRNKQKTSYLFTLRRCPWCRVCLFLPGTQTLGLCYLVLDCTY